MLSRNFGLFVLAFLMLFLLIITPCVEGDLSKTEASNLQEKDQSKQTPNHLYNLRKLLLLNSDNGSLQPPTGSHTEGPKKKKWQKQLLHFLPYILSFAFAVLLLIVIYFVARKRSKNSKKRDFLKSLADASSQISPHPMQKDDMKLDEERSELVFFVNDQETFKLDDLFEATADLQSHSLYSSLYKVILKNDAVYAVKRLKKLQISFDEFGRMMKQIGNLKHPNILPLIGYNSTKEEKLLIYKYQSSGTLLDLLEDHIAGKKLFPWKLRLSIATGIARGLDFIYQNQIQPIPHGNIKSSNILLDENEEPLISEYGHTKLLDRKTTSLLTCSSYTAPEKILSEQGDVFSFGIILLELLTGKTVEKTGVDLPKWVRSMVREEWTGEVFDKELNIAARECAFPLLNVALKCVSVLADDRPSIAEVMEKIEEVGNVNDDVSISSMASESSPRDCCLLHTVIPETWDTPASNY